MLTRQKKSWKKRQLHRQGAKCYYCKCKLDTRKIEPGERKLPNSVTVDHLLAKALGGTDNKKNLVLACHSCNNQKGSKTLIEFSNQ